MREESRIPLSVPLPDREGLGVRVPPTQRRSNRGNHRRQIIPHRDIRQPEHPDPAPPKIIVAHFVVSLLLAMRASIDLHHQPRRMTIEIHDVRREHLLSPEVRPQPIPAKFRQMTCSSGVMRPRNSSARGVSSGFLCSRRVNCGIYWLVALDASKQNHLTPDPVPQNLGTVKSNSMRSAGPFPNPHRGQSSTGTARHGSQHFRLSKRRMSVRKLYGYLETNPRHP